MVRTEDSTRLVEGRKEGKVNIVDGEKGKWSCECKWMHVKEGN